MSATIDFGRALLKVVLMLQLLTSEYLASSQPTYENRNRSSPEPQQDNNQLMTSSLILAHLKQMSSVLDEVNKKSNQQTDQVLNPKPNDVSGTYGILVQQHYVGTTVFNRSWLEYKTGFSDGLGNYWIGNERLHQLTKDGRYKLRVDLLSKYNSKWYYAEYQTFVVLQESTWYTLVVNDYSGTAPDQLQHNNGMRFSTRDSDNDNNSGHNCATYVTHGNNGGFWYSSCGNVYINSPPDGQFGFTWYGVAGQDWSNAKLIVSRMTMFLK